MARNEDLLKKAEETQTYEVPFRKNWMEIQHAVIMWPDFTGKITKFHKKLGEKRSFCLLCNDVLLASLHAYEERAGVKFDIKERPLYTPEQLEKFGCEQVMMRWVNVKVNFENEENPIHITMFTDYNGVKSRQPVTKDTATILDSIQIQDAAMKVSFWQSPDFPDSCASIYLKDLKVIQEPQAPEYGGMFEAWAENTQVSVNTEEEEAF